MTADTDTTPTSPGISGRVLILAVAVTAALTGGATWALLHQPAAATEEADEHANELPPGEVALTPEAQKNAGLTIIDVASQGIPNIIDMTGTVTPDEARVAHVRPLARGVIEQVSVRLGARVTRGQALATYDNIQLGEYVGEYLSAKAMLRQAEAERDSKRQIAERGRALIALEAIARQTLDLREAEVKAAEAAVASMQATVSRVEEQLHRFGLSDEDLGKLSTVEGKGLHRESSHAVLRAPFDGVITRYDVAEGELVEPDRELFTVTDISTVWVLADIYEKDLTKVRTGSEATIRLDAYPDRAFTGRIAFIADSIDPQSRSAKARIVVANPTAELKLDMFARISVPTADQREALVIPLAAVQRVDNQPIVFVQLADNRFARREVELGSATGDLVEVRLGLTPGERIVSAGSFYLKTALLRERIGDVH
jgi:cobalt-zinc-cadmium efflux system membrane fusion protein